MKEKKKKKRVINYKNYKKKMSQQRVIKSCNCFTESWLSIRLLFGEQVIASIFNLEPTEAEILGCLVNAVMEKDESKSVCVRIVQKQYTLYVFVV